MLFGPWKGFSEHGSTSIPAPRESSHSCGAHMPVGGDGKGGEMGLEGGGEKQFTVISTVDVDIFLAACGQSCKRYFHPPLDSAAPLKQGLSARGGFVLQGTCDSVRRQVRSCGHVAGGGRAAAQHPTAHRAAAPQRMIRPMCQPRRGWEPAPGAH